MKNKKILFESYEEYKNLQIKKAKKTRVRTRSQSRINRRQWIFNRMEKLGIKEKTILCIGARDDSEVIFFRDKGYNALGIDLIESNEIIKCDMSKVHEHPYLKNQKYDIVFVSEALEHCLDFEGFIIGLNLICKKYFICMGPTYSKIKKMGGPDQWDCNFQSFMFSENIKKGKIDNNLLLDAFKEFEIIISEVHKRGTRLFFILRRKNIEKA